MYTSPLRALLSCVSVPWIVIDPEPLAPLVTVTPEPEASVRLPSLTLSVSCSVLLPANPSATLIELPLEVENVSELFSVTLAVDGPETSGDRDDHVRHEQIGDGSPEAGGQVVARPCGVPVVAGGDVVEVRAGQVVEHRQRLGCAVERGEAVQGPSLIDDRDQSGPHRTREAGAADRSSSRRQRSPRSARRCRRPSRHREWCGRWN